MKIQCDSCGVAAATVVCCADEAALCARCDVEVHSANTLAGKHERLPLDALGASPRCDVCQEKPAFVFCVEDRALLCGDCDAPIHVAGTLSANHHRFLATGIRVGVAANVVSTCAGHDDDNHHANAQQVPSSPPQLLPQGWAMDDLLHFSDYESSDKVSDHRLNSNKESSHLGFKELEWFAADMDLFHDDESPLPKKDVRTAAEVPEFFASQAAYDDDDYYYRPSKSKKARVEITDDDDFFIVPDLG